MSAAALRLFIEQHAIAALITWSTGFLMGTVLVGSMRKFWRGPVHSVVHDIRDHLGLIADRLDADTPGGLGEVKATLEKMVTEESKQTAAEAEQAQAVQEAVGESQP